MTVTTQNKNKIIDLPKASIIADMATELSGMSYAWFINYKTAST